jgi:hypothetical protein
MNQQNLDRITNLGFNLTINWNKDIMIVYENVDLYFASSFSEDIFVLIYTYPLDPTYQFSSALDLVVDEFNSWYSLNHELVEEWVETKSDSIIDKITTLGDISNKINRQLRIDGLLGENYDF